MFKEMYEEYEEKVQFLIREGFKYGIQVVCTGNSVGDLNYKTRQYIAKVIPLYLGDKSKYMEALGCSIDYEPADIKGRGLWHRDDVLEFQTALITDEANALVRNQQLKEQFADISAKLGEGNGAKQVQTIPKEEAYVQLLEKVDDYDLIPLGYNEQNLNIETISMYEIYCYVISAHTKQSVQLFMKNLKTAFAQRDMEVTVIKEGIDYHTLFDLAIELRDTFTERSDYRKSLETDEDESNRKTYEHFAKRVYLIENLSDFIERLYAPVKAEQEVLYPIFEIFFKKGSHMGIVFIAHEEISDHYNVMSKTAGKYFLSYKQGIHFGGKLDQQKLFDFAMPVSKQIKVLDYNVGTYMVQNEFYQIYVPIN